MNKQKIVALVVGSLIAGVGQAYILFRGAESWFGPRATAVDATNAAADPASGTDQGQAELPTPNPPTPAAGAETPPNQAQPMPPPLQQPPDAVTPPPASAQNVTLVQRYPNIEAPDRVKPGQRFSLQVSLTVDSLMPGMQIRPAPGAQVDPDGRLTMALPRHADGSPWQIGVVLTAPDFDISGDNHANLSLTEKDDSTPAVFTLTAKGRPSRTDVKISATFWHEGSYLARAIRSVEIDPAGRLLTPDGRDEVAPRPPATEFSSAVIGTQEQAPDLTVYVQEFKGPSGTTCQETVESPYLTTASGACIPGEQLNGWLNQQYQQILTAEKTFRGTSVPGRPAAMGKPQMLAMMRGIGMELYRRAAGPQFDSAFWQLVDSGKLHNIQIYTNNPVIPWELMVPSRQGRPRDGFLGTEFQVARWHIDQDVTSHEKPPRKMPIHRVVAIAPNYAGSLALPFQKEEMSSLQKMQGFGMVNGKIRDMQALLNDPPDGIVHFAGHGVAQNERGGGVQYAIQLEDATLDLSSWRGFARTGGTRHPLYFINACEIGQTDQVLNFVEGWAPTVLDGGASGFIGGLWPLSDEGASEFAAKFYGQMQTALQSGGGANVAQMVSGARQQFFDSGDPTFLGYVFYGDVNLQVADK